MHPWAALFIICLVVAWSLWLRMCHCRNTAEEIPTKGSPFSNSVQDLVATAGGVYLSLVMLVSFLKLDIPTKISLLEVSLDPLAFMAIGIAIIQPIFPKFLNKE